MSRVFDALTRANEERKEQPLLPADDKVREPASDSANGDGAISQWQLDDHEGPQAVFSPPLAEPAAKSWRERLEEFLFGWGLSQLKSYPIVALETESAAAEQYKILREQVKRIRAESGARSICITSPVKQDGKTTVCVNLAAAIALEYEEQVLLIDADLRSPQVHRYFGIERGPGLAEYLSGNGHEDIGSYVRDTFLPGLKVLTAGRRSELSAELLAKIKLRDLMDEIRLKFPTHQIMVDAPPILSTPDPLILAREVDGIIMVIRARKTPRDYLLKAIQSLNSSKLVGIVLNDVNLGMNSRYYYYYSERQD